MVDRAASLTDEEIDEAKVPLPWFRQALRMLRRELGGDLTELRVRSQIEKHVVDGINPDPMGEMREFVGGTRFVQLRQGELEVDTGFLFWLSDEGGAWLDTIFVRQVDPALMTGSRSLGRMPRTAYQAAVRDRRNRRVVPSEREVQPLFRIERL